MQDLVIVGAGGHGREILDVVEAVNALRQTWRFIGFLDDGEPDRALLCGRDAELLGGSEQLAHLDAAYVIGIGDGDARRAIDGRAPGQAATLVHPMASLGSGVRLSPGVVLASGARVTTNVEIGRHSHLNVNAVVSHDCRLDDYVTLSPGALVNGGVTIGAGVLLGTAAVVTPGVTLGPGCWIGAGAVVLDDVPAAVVAYGVPARVRRSR